MKKQKSQIENIGIALATMTTMPINTAKKCLSESIKTIFKPTNKARKEAEALGIGMPETVKMEQFTVRWKYGKAEVWVDLENRRIRGFRKVSANVVEQIIEQIQDRMKKIGGNYAWYLNQSWDYNGSKVYEVVAKWKDKHWIDGCGKSPMKAFFNCAVIRQVFGGI